MELTTEALLALGMSNEDAAKVLEAHKAAVAGKYVPKSRFDEMNAELQGTRSQVSERDTQIAALKEFEGTVSQLKAQVAKLEGENKAKDAETAAKLETERIGDLVRMDLTGKVHDVDLVMTQLDMAKVSRSDKGELVGYAEQRDTLLQGKPFLAKPDNAAAGDGGQPKGTNATPDVLNGLGFKVVGDTPQDGGGKPDPARSAAALGKSLAEKRLAVQKQVDAGAKHYFNQK